MALQKNDLFKLASIAANAKASSPIAYSFGEEKFTIEEVNAALRKELGELSKDYRTYRANQNTIFELIEKTIDEVLPVKVQETYAAFAETMQVAQGDRYVFTQRITEAAKKRAKKFVTRVGLAGVYEVFKLDGQSFEVQTSAIGGACYIPFEEFLDGRVSWSDVYDILLEGMNDWIYVEIEKALQALLTNPTLPANNKTTQAGFVESVFDNMLLIADSYSNGPSTIYCTFEFAAKMVPTQGVWQNQQYSGDMKNELWRNGYFTQYKNHNVVILKQSIADENNTTKVIDPSFVYILPNGAEKPVKIVFEGDTCVREKTDNGDWSRELHTYKKVGVGLITVNKGICIYKDSQGSKTI